MANARSNYYKNLDENDKNHYDKKLILSDGTAFPDPWYIENGWSNDVALLPNIMYGDVWEYLVETPSEFTGEKMKTYKSLEAYKYYLAGHVQDVHILKINNLPYYALKTEVIN